MNTLLSRRIHTPVGTMIAIADTEAILSLDFTDTALPQADSDHPLLLLLEKELGEYFGGKRRSFTLPLAPKGTPFQKKIWDILLTIPYGETIPYALEAKRYGNPKAARAVAGANARNPIAILIPCHRVIATGGGIGGYSGGIGKKEFLLDLERNTIIKSTESIEKEE